MNERSVLSFISISLLVLSISGRR